MKVIAVINQKGGVGKTTTVANLGAAIAMSGRYICLLDMDAQAHLTLHLGLEPGASDLSMYELLTSDASIDAAAAGISEHLWLVPSSIDLAAAEMELASTVGREQILRDRIEASSMPYDFIMIDCPPSLGLLTLNALAAADEVIIPLQPHFLALQGLGKLLETVALVQKRINPRLRVTGVILCMYESNTRLTGEVQSDLEKFFESCRGTNVPWADAHVFPTHIRRNVKLAESPSFGQTIFAYEPNSNGAADYEVLAGEFLERHPAEKAAAVAPVAAPAPAVSEVAPVLIAAPAPAETPAMPEAAVAAEQPAPAQPA